MLLEVRRLVRQVVVLRVWPGEIGQTHEVLVFVEAGQGQAKLEVEGPSECQRAWPLNCIAQGSVTDVSIIEQYQNARRIESTLGDDSSAGLLAAVSPCLR